MSWDGGGSSDQGLCQPLARPSTEPCAATPLGYSLLSLTFWKQEEVGSDENNREEQQQLPTCLSVLNTGSSLSGGHFWGKRVWRSSDGTSTGDGGGSGVVVNRS